MRSLSLALVAVGLLGVVGTACSDDGGAASEHLGEADSPLSSTDPVSAMVTGPCNTSPIEPLATQLIAEVNCLSPGAFASIKNLPGTRVSAGQFVFPYLQTYAVNSLKQVLAARGTTMSLNSGLRSLPEQFVLYRWYQTGRCGITLAATPGTSNHESGLALDIEDNVGWRSYFLAKGWHWQGASDPVHYDIAGGVNMKGLSVRAFQRLWNRNHPADKITEDGVYGPATEARIQSSPIGGFALGATCAAPPDAGAKDAGHQDAGGDAATEGSETPPAADPPDDDAGPALDDAPPPADASGCNASNGGRAGTGGVLVFAFAASTAWSRRRRRRRRA